MTGSKKRLTCVRKNLVLKVFLAAGFAALALGGGARGQEATVLEDRQRLLEAVRRDGADAAPVLSEALDDERTLVNRTAAHLLARLGEDALPGVEKALGHPDFQVRHIAIDALVEAGLLADYLKPIMTDEHASVRRRFRFQLLPGHLLEDGEPTPDLMGRFAEVYRDAPVELRRFLVDTANDLPATDATLNLLEMATEDEDDGIRAIAVRAVTEPELARVEELSDARRHQDLVDEFKDVDYTAWPEDMAYEALRLLGEAYRSMGEGEEAEEAYKRAIEYRPDRRAILGLARNYRDNLADEARALEAYERAVEATVGFGGHLLYSSILEGTALLRRMDRPDDALAFLDRYWPDQDFDEWAGTWPFSFLAARAQTLEAVGRKEDALEYHRRALRVSRIRDSQRESAERAIEKLEQALGEDWRAVKVSRES